MAAVNNDTSINSGKAEDFAGRTGSLTPDVLDGISFGSCVDFMGLCSPVSPLPCPGFGDGGGVGILLDFWVDVVGALSPEVLAFEALRKFSRPLRLGTRKL